MNKLTEGNLSPAYGRVYKARRDVVADFEDGKDFIFNGPKRGTYCSARDFTDTARIQFRYGPRGSLTFMYQRGTG